MRLIVVVNIYFVSAGLVHSISYPTIQCSLCSYKLGFFSGFHILWLQTYWIHACTFAIQRKKNPQDDKQS